MADPAFVEMEAEVETPSASTFLYTRVEQDDKLNIPTVENNTATETAPLLGPPTLDHGGAAKRWYNTASVYLLFVCMAYKE